MIVVTGATGFLGSTLVRQLVADGEAVRIVRRVSSPMDLLGEAAESVEHVVAELDDPDALAAAMEGARHVYHAAAFVGFGGRRDRERLHEINVIGTANVVDAARRAGVERLVHVSSIAALGRPAVPPKQPIDETQTWVESGHTSEYARSKYRAELEVQRAIAEGLDAVLVNPALIMGPGRAGENTMAIAERVRRGLPLAPKGGTCIVDVADAALGMRAAMAHGATGERYLLGGDNLPWRVILDTLAEAMGVPGPRGTLPPRLGLAAAVFVEAFDRLRGRPPALTRESVRTTAQFFRYDSSKAREHLGWSSRPFAETAARIAAAMPG